jgi:LPS export ABC transporter protein LptC
MALAIGMFAGCKNSIEDIASYTEMDDLPIETRKEVKMYYSQNGKVAALLTAPLMERFVNEEDYTIMNKGIYVETYDSAMVVTSSIKADYGKNRPKAGLMEAKGNVKVVNEKGEVLNTEELFWDSKAGEIYTEKYVKITTKDEIIEGDGLVSNQDFSEYRIKKIRGIISLEDAENN